MHSVSGRRAGCRKSCGSNRRCKGKTPYAAAYYRYSALRIPLPHPCLHPGYSLAWDRCDELRQSTAFVSRNSRTFSAYASFPLRGRIRSVWPSSVHCWSAGAAGSGSLTRRRHSRTLGSRPPAFINVLVCPEAVNLTAGANVHVLISTES